MKSVIRRGFTLVEILAVIAIIAVIAAIMFTVFSSSKKSALQTKCISNLHQFGVAASMYCGDNDQFLPPYLTQTPNPLKNGRERALGNPKLWKEALMPYIKSDGIFWCPEDTYHQQNRIPPLAEDDKFEDNRWQYTSYQTWHTLGHSKFLGSDRSLRLSELQDVVEGARYLTDAAFHRRERRPKEEEFYSFHGDNVHNVLFLDWHVEKVPISE